MRGARQGDPGKGLERATLEQAAAQRAQNSAQAGKQQRMTEAAVAEGVGIGDAELEGQHVGIGQQAEQQAGQQQARRYHPRPECQPQGQDWQRVGDEGGHECSCMRASWRSSSEG